MELPDYLVDSLHRAAVAVEQTHDLREEQARAAWRQYACAAMTGGSMGLQAATRADEMLRLERERFAKETP